MRSPELERVGAELLKALPAPLHADTSSVAYGVRTTKPAVANVPWLPRPEALPPQLTYVAQTGLKEQATLVSGAWPTTPNEVRRTVAIRDGRTSSEVLRRTEVDAATGQESQVAREYAMLDRAGRLQLPADYTQTLGMEHRVLLELELDHIGVWPDAHGAPENEAPDRAPEKPDGPSKDPMDPKEK